MGNITQGEAVSLGRTDRPGTYPGETVSEETFMLESPDSQGCESYTFRVVRNRFGLISSAYFANFEQNLTRFLWKRRNFTNYGLRTPKEILTERGYNVSGASEDPWCPPFYLGDDEALDYPGDLADAPDCCIEHDSNGKVPVVEVGRSKYLVLETDRDMNVKQGCARAWLVLEPREYRIFTFVGDLSGTQLYLFSEQPYSENPKSDIDDALEWWLEKNSR